MKLRANEKIELENAIGTLARIEMRVISEIGLGPALGAARVRIDQARQPILNLLRESDNA